MKRFSEHLDYLPLFTGGPINNIHQYKTPTNDFITPTVLTVASLAATAAGTTIGVMESRSAAKQAEMNAEAEAKALQTEEARKRAELAENTRRQAFEQRRFRSTQIAALANSGFLTGTGTALEIEADTWAQQNRELADMTYLNTLERRKLNFAANQALLGGQQAARQYRGQALGTALGGFASIASDAAKLIPEKPEGPSGGATSPPTVLSGKAALKV